MKLPNAHLAVVEPEKIRDYLLNPAHRYGSSKASFFGSFGFYAANWPSLADALLLHGQESDVAKRKDTSFGPRYEIEGPLLALDGRLPLIRTVWQMDEGMIAPRLITAYPI